MHNILILANFSGTSFDIFFPMGSIVLSSYASSFTFYFYHVRNPRKLIKPTIAGMIPLFSYKQQTSMMTKRNHLLRHGSHWQFLFLNGWNFIKYHALMIFILVQSYQWCLTPNRRECQFYWPWHWRAEKYPACSHLQ